ncbi:hypothetical protein EBZ38_01705 [bacterium]|nr:hypothetical protein [bacterium]
MILFDWEKIRSDSKGKIGAIIQIISAITWPEVLPTKRQLIVNKFYGKDFSGNSFLLNPESLLNKKYELKAKDIVEYIMLASKRSYADYLITGNRTLNVRLLPYVIASNELITIKNNEIYFKYEGS